MDKNSKTNSHKLSLIPWPQDIKISNKIFNPKEKLFLITNNDTLVQQIAKTCIEDFNKLGFDTSIEKESSKNHGSTIDLKLVNEEMEKEEYQLSIKSDISISSNSIIGLFWGTRTLMQLFENGPKNIIPQLNIRDKPKFEYRGLMIDNAREFHSIDFHIQTIKKMAEYKLNNYHIHFSDNESYTLPSNAFPKLPTENKHFTKNEINRLIATADKYHINIIPEIDVPGHTGTLIKKIPELKCDSGEKICIGNKKSYSILKTLFQEVMEMIPGPFWHLGADEVKYPDLNRCSCDNCYSTMKKENFKKGKELFNFFINNMYSFIKKKGRKMLIWEGFDPVIEPNVNKNIFVCPFDVKFEGILPMDYLNSGYKLLNTSWTPLYIANIYMTTPEIIAKWDPYLFGAGRAPQPYKYWKKVPENSPVLGAQMCSWGNEEKSEWGLLFDSGPGFPDYGRPAPRLQIMAERVWSGRETTSKNILERVGEHYW